MRVTAVPAQVTTVEDRIMGNLGFSQLVLFVIPVFVGAGLFIVLPPVMHGSLYKYIVAGIIAAISGILAIRIKGKIILLWLVTILHYNLRPKYYLFNKNVSIYREDYRSHQPEPETATKQPTAKPQSMLPRLGFHEAAQILATIEKPESNLRFEMTKKGGLHVRLTEVED
jgi:hypothetical protein